MKITCLITVCAYLSSTVFTDEIQYLNRLRRIRSREDSVLNNATARKELNSNTEIRPDPVFSTLRKSRSQKDFTIETFQKPFQTKFHESHPSLRQQRPRSKHSIKRLKVRSIGSTYEVNGNEVHEIIHESIPEVHNEGPIYIKPVVRVMKKNIFDSIMDVLRQLLDPPKKGAGPIVGPIKMPGSKRKIYLRLLEPVDSSHINVRFVTQIPVPVVDEESILSREHESILPFLPFIDPSATGFLNRHPVATSDVTFSSSNRHHSVQSPRNASHVSSKEQRSQPTTKLKRPSENFGEKETDKENASSVKVEAASGAESEKNHLYYRYQSEDDAVKSMTEIIKDATENKQGSKDSSEAGYRLTTHRLPLRQIAPLYPLSTMEHESGSYENTYKVPSDSLTVPGSHSSSYEQYSNVNAGASGIYDQSSYTIPSTYQKQNEFSNHAPISYQNQNEFNNGPSSTSYIKQNDLFIAPTTHTSTYEKPANVPPPSGSYATSPDAQNGIQTSSSSQNALRVIDPPLHLLDPREVLENHANKVFEHPAIRQQPYNLPNVNEIGSTLRKHTAQNGELPLDQATWNKVKREKNELNVQRSESHFQKNELNFQKSESNFQKNVEMAGSDDNREKWQPLTLVSEDWHETFANSAKIANGNDLEIIARQRSINRPREASRNTMPENTIETGKVDERGGESRGKRRKHSVASTQNSRCSPADKGDRCGRMKSTIVSTSHPENTTKIANERTQSAADIEPIVITPKSLVISNTVEMSRSHVTTKSSWMEEPQPLVMASSTTKTPPLLLKVMKNTTEKSIEKKTTSGSMTKNITEKLAASGTTERSSISGTSKMSIPRNNTVKRLQLPKLPMIMKKPTLVLKRMESSSTTRGMMTSSTTRKPTIGSTTEKTKTTKRLTFRSRISKTKSSTT